MPRRRKLRPEELALWQAVARKTRPLHPQGHALPAAEGPASTAASPAEPAAARPRPPPGAHAPPAPLPRPLLAPFRLGERALPPASARTARPGPALRMDAATHARMLRGKLAPEARLDLHGMTLAEARPELIRFLLAAHAGGRRLVLVITGKGREITDPVPRPMGALRHQVPHWLRLAPLDAVVLQTAEAHLRHGGAGALYVFLRRGRG